MRYAIVADVHANLPALEATVDFIGTNGVDQYVCAGDMVGYGPNPNECVRMIRDLGAICVRGNHDEMATGETTPLRGTGAAIEAAKWTREHLELDVREFLVALPRITEVGPMIITHGSLDRTNEYIRTEKQARDQLRILQSRWPSASMLVLGHTHRARAYPTWTGNRWVGKRTIKIRPHTRYVVNPGSVGQPRQWEPQPRARFAVVDDDAHVVTFFAIDYDSARARAALRRQGLPTDSLYSAGGHAAVLRRFVRRARRAFQD